MKLFKTGMFCLSRGVIDLLDENFRFAAFVCKSMKRYVKKDWGDIVWSDAEANDVAIENGDRIFAAYKQGDWKIWIITEADRSTTTIMFPDEY